LIALVAGLSCRPSLVPDTGAAKQRRAAAAAEEADTIEGCRTKPTDTGLVVSCVADHFVLELPGLSEGFVWSLRRPPDPTQTHIVFVAEDTRNRADLYSISVLVGPEADEGRNIPNQLSSLYERLRHDTRESGKTDPKLGRDLGPARPCETPADRRPCISYEVRGMSLDGKPAASTHAWTASRRDDGSVLFFHAAWAGLAAPHAEHSKQLAKVGKRMRGLLDTSYVVDAEGHRVAD
jgi:hypothetical protein